MSEGRFIRYLEDIYISGMSSFGLDVRNVLVFTSLLHKISIMYHILCVYHGLSYCANFFYKHCPICRNTAHDHIKSIVVLLLFYFFILSIFY